MRNAEKFLEKVLKFVVRIAGNEVKEMMLGKTAECATIWH